MKLNTYASEAIPGCFVTIPSATATSTISLVEGLGALQLNLFRLAYRLPAEPYDSPFTVSVLTQIVDKGYAVHGPDASCAPAVTRNRPRPRSGRQRSGRD